MAAFLAAAVLPLAVTACGGSGGGGTTGAAAGDWGGPPRADLRGRLDVGSFDDYLDAHPGAAIAPVVVATTFLRLDRTHALRTSIDVISAGEGASQARVTVALDGILDDSVRAQRFVLRVDRNADGEWRITSADVTQRCRRGRGHETFGPAPCL